MMSIRVLLADDHVLMHRGMRAWLQSIPQVEVVGEASDGHEALHLMAKVQPDVVLMDIGMPRLNGLEATLQVTKEFPQVRVLPVPEVGWSDWGSEERILMSLVRIGKLKECLARLHARRSDEENTIALLR
jgi:chemotaxis response regulator CheB